MARMKSVSHQYGPLVLVLTRGMPVFAEASVLIAGIHKLSWRRFLPAVTLSNLGVAIAYSVLGDFAEQYQWLPLALGIAVALPVLIAAVAQKYFPSDDSPETTTPADSTSQRDNSPTA